MPTDINNLFKVKLYAKLYERYNYNQFAEK